MAPRMGEISYAEYMGMLRDQSEKLGPGLSDLDRSDAKAKAIMDKLSMFDYGEFKRGEFLSYPGECFKARYPMCPDLIMKCTNAKLSKAFLILLSVVHLVYT